MDGHRRGPGEGEQLPKVTGRGVPGAQHSHVRAAGRKLPWAGLGDSLRWSTISEGRESVPSPLIAGCSKLGAQGSGGHRCLVTGPRQTSLGGFESWGFWESFAGRLQGALWGKEQDGSSRKPMARQGRARASGCGSPPALQAGGLLSHLPISAASGNGDWQGVPQGVPR